MKTAARFAALLLLLLLVGAAFATVPGKPTVMDIRGGWHRRSSVSVASTSQSQDSYTYGYDNYGVEEKEVCLQEVERKACYTHFVEGCDSSGNSNECDRVHSFWTSDLTCCNDKHDYGYSRGSATVGDHLWGSGSHGGTIGSCDWTWHYVDDDAATFEGWIPITGNIFKLGSANAVCFFGADSQDCGGPFCERMVMSLEGNIYEVARVYSYWGVSDTTQTDNSAFTTCDLAEVYIDAGNTGRKAGHGDKQVTPAPASAVAKPSSHQPSDAHAQHADTQYYHDEGHYDNRPVYGGRAVVINGIVNSMAGPRKDKWDNGVFEYVMAFQTNSVAITGGLDASLPWIRDKAYKFTFYKQAHGY